MMDEPPSWREIRRWKDRRRRNRMWRKAFRLHRDWFVARMNKTAEDAFFRTDPVLEITVVPEEAEYFPGGYRIHYGK